MSLNAAVVGTGIFASNVHLPTLQKLDGVTPYAAFNRTRSKAEAFAAKAGIEVVADSLESVFQDTRVDFVDALLPVQSNLDVVKLAVKHNKPLAIEKPVAANLDQAREIVKIAEASSVPIAVLEQWHFRAAIRIIHDILPKIGDVVGFTYNATGAWNEQNKYADTKWRQNPQHIGGYLSDGGVHQLALLTEVLGPVASVSGLARQVRQESGTSDTLFSTLKLDSGAIGTFTYTSALGATDKSTSFVIYGTNGSVVYDWSPALPKPTITYQTGISSQSASQKTVIDVDEVDAVEEEFKNFVRAVRSNNKDLIGVKPAKAFHHLAIIAAALHSSENGGSAVPVESP